MMNRLLILASILIGMLSLVSVRAQDEATIEYGEVVTGEITDREFEIPFSFSGKEGDVIVVELAGVDP